MIISVKIIHLFFQQDVRMKLMGVLYFWIYWRRFFQIEKNVTFDELPWFYIPEKQ